MVVTIDLRLDPAGQARPGGDRVLKIGDLASLARRPRRLARMLRGSEVQRVEVLRDLRPLGVLDAGGLVLTALARTASFEVHRGELPVVVQGRASFRASALAGFGGALIAELVLTARQVVAAAAISRRPFRLRRSAAAPRVVAYVRGEPSLRWMGAKVGGAATHTSGVINGLTKLGLDVHVFAADTPAGLDTAGTTTVPPQRLFQLVPWLTLFAYSRQLAAAAEPAAPDFVYQRNALGSYAGLEMARRLDVPLVLEFNHSELWVQKNWGSKRPAFERVAMALERRNVFDASLLVCSSDVLKDNLTALGVKPDRILVNPNGVDVDRFAYARAADPTEWRERLGREQAPTVGFVGTFGLWHGVKELPAIVEAVTLERPDVRWVIIGDGSLREEVAADIAARGLGGVVDLTGVVAHDQAIELLASCDVCVSPHVPNPDGTRFFGSPTKLFEYMGLGKPIVASDLEQIGEVLDHERSALLCLPGDAAAAAAGVVRLLADPELALRLGSAALADASEHYSWNAHTRRILDALAAQE